MGWRFARPRAPEEDVMFSPYGVRPNGAHSGGDECPTGDACKPDLLVNALRTRVDKISEISEAVLVGLNAYANRVEVAPPRVGGSLARKLFYGDGRRHEQREELYAATTGPSLRQ